MHKRAQSVQPTLIDFFSKKPKPNSGIRTEPAEPNTESVLQSIEAQRQEDSEAAHDDPNDISTFLQKIKSFTPLSNEDKRAILCGLTIPETMTFPKTIDGHHKRSFQTAWIRKFQWLCYSIKLDKAFCRFCILNQNTMTGKGSHERSSLSCDGYSSWKTAIVKFEKHEKTQCHLNATTSAGNLKKILDGERLDILSTIDSHRKVEIVKNRRILGKIVESIIWLGRQGLALRGDKDSGNVVQSPTTTNEGNFRELLRFRIQSGDLELERHFFDCPSNAMYTSADIQNEIIQICGSFIQETIVQKICAAKFFSILVDETSDISNVEQLVLCARFFDNGECKLTERFLEFVAISDMSAKAITDTILSSLLKLGLDIENLRGQGYDGCSTMKGHINGVRTLISERYPKALYTHCASHCLNLVLSDACTMQDIRNCFGTIKEVHSYFSRSPKRENMLKNTIDFPEHSGITKSKLISLCETRWVERHDAVLQFSEMILSIVTVLEKLEISGDNESASKSCILQKAVRDSNFLISLVCSETVLAITLPISRALQGCDVDLSYCYDMVQNIIGVLGTMRERSEQEFSAIFRKASNIASQLEVEIQIPRTCKRQINRANYETAEPETYYRQAIFIPFLDQVISSLTSRFESHSSSVCKLFSLLPKYIVHLDDFNQFQSLFDNYHEDLACSYSSLLGELRMWKDKWVKHSGEFPSNSVEVLVKCDKTFYPNVYTLIQILCTLPVTTSTAERSFSSLRRLKTYLRNTMSERRLNGLAVINVNRDVCINIEAVVNRFAEKSRKIKLLL